MGSNAAGEVVGRFYEAFGAGNIDAALSVCADDLEIIDPGMGQVRGRGTQTGPLATQDGDVAPTGAAVDLRFADVSRVRDGKVVAYHTYYDQLGFLTQLGLMDQTS